MTAGRPRTADPTLLYRVASHLYWELKMANDGAERIAVNHEKQRQLERELKSQLNQSDIEEIKAAIDRQIQVGWLPESERETRIRIQKEDLDFELQFSASNAARRRSEITIRVPGVPQLIDAMFRATAANQFKKICADGFGTGKAGDRSEPTWQVSTGSLLPSALQRHASQFIKAKASSKSPKSSRETSRLKQIWFLSRALAAAEQGISTRTAINLLGSVRPDEVQDPTRLTKRPRRPKKPTKRKS